MIKELKSFILNGKGYLSNSNLWKSLDVDYFPPRVERLYRTDNGFRYYLHRIHHTNDACLMHKHRWPSAVMLLEGAYEMGIAHCDYDIDTYAAYRLPMVKTILTPGSVYEMVERDSMHYVKPLTETSLSIMVSGPLFTTAPSEILDKKLMELHPDIIEEMLETFITKWPTKNYII